MHAQKEDRVVNDGIALSAKTEFLSYSDDKVIDEGKNVFNVSADAMEQAKFKAPSLAPRDRCKDSQVHWKPQVHVSGVVMDGVQENWFLASHIAQECK